MRVYFYKIVFVGGKANPVFTARPKVFAHRTGAAFEVSSAGIDRVRQFCREYSERLIQMLPGDRSFCAFLGVRGGEKRRRHELRLNDATFELDMDIMGDRDGCATIENYWLCEDCIMIDEYNNVVIDITDDV